MSRPTRVNVEGFSSRPSEMAWGCVKPVGWVPFPPRIPRRHPLLDTVGRVDDPCDRPAYEPPDFRPKPSFKAPREGCPNDLCNLQDYASQRDQGDGPEGSAMINIAGSTPHNIHIKIPAVVNTSSCPDDLTTTDECCEENRNLDIVKEKHDEVVGTSEKGNSEKSPAQQILPEYPCRGVIDEVRKPEWEQIPEEQLCKPLSLRSGEDSRNWKDQKPVTGWEFIDKCRTCDYYPISPDLPRRFNHPSWFKGYGCEVAVHPFYVTTSADYGRFGPNPHTMTQMYFPRFSDFTEVLGKTGMYRNRTLNTSSNKTLV